MARYIDLKLEANEVNTISHTRQHLVVSLEMESGQLFTNASTLGLELDDSEKMDLIRELYSNLTDKDQTILLGEFFGSDEFEDFPDYHHQAMGCGLEDRNITDRYQAMEHGWENGVDKTGAAVSAWLAEKLGR